MKKQLLLVLGLALAAPQAARAQSELEKLSANANTDFSLKAGLLGAKKRSDADGGGAFVFKGPSSFGKAGGDDLSGGVVVLSQQDGRGGAGGVELDLPANALGTSGVIGITGFAKSAPAGVNSYYQGNNSFIGGPTIGLRQRFFQAGIQGVTLVPNVSVGWAPFSWIRTYGSGVDMHGKDGYTPTSGSWAPVTGYAAAGLGVRVADAVEVCVETRCYASFQKSQPSLWATGVTLTLLPGNW